MASHSCIAMENGQGYPVVVSLKENGSKGSSTIRRYVFVGVCVVFLEEVCLCGVGL